ncbi:MAG: triacylglycerol lipase [Woeseiaceae bacterium]
MNSRFPGVALSIATAMVLGGCLSAPTNAAVKKGADACVILLHGLARTADSMNKMQHALESSGYHVANIDYPSRYREIEFLSVLAIENGLNKCREKGDFDTVHFVTHSLGGILVRHYLASNDIPNLGRVVMLGPPNQGSHAADVFRGVPGVDWMNGPVGGQLGKGPESIPLRLGKAEFELGIIAGDQSIDPITSAVLENPDDGRVTVEETKLEGMQDFRIVGVSHAFIMKDNEVIDLVTNFLEYGSFDAGVMAE